jgi:uncharacterized protein involved in exopolysaccharide biosynthesis
MDTISFFRKHWKKFIVLPFVAAMAGLAYDYFEKPAYESKLTFSIDAESTGGTLSTAMNLASQFGLGFGSTQSMFDGDNIIEIMKSRSMNEKVLLTSAQWNNKEVTLADFFMEMNGYKKKKRLASVSFPVGADKSKFSYLQDSLLYVISKQLIKNGLTVSRPDKRLSIFEVKVRTKNEKFSKLYTERLVDITSKFYVEITSKKDKETLDILEQRVASIKNEVSHSIDNRAYNIDVNLNPAFSQPQTPAYKQQYNIQAYSDAYREMFKNLEIARYKYLKKIPLIQIIDNADYPMNKIKLGKLYATLLFLAVMFVLMYIYLRFVHEKEEKINPAS